MGVRFASRIPILGFVTMAMLGSVLFTNTATADAASLGTVDVCRSFPTYSEVTHGALVPGLTPAVDAAIVVGDPDAERYPMVVARYPDETGLWASAGTRGVELAIAAAATSTPTGVLAGLAPARHDREISDSIVRIYCGLLGRQADALDIEYWARRYWNGLPLSSIAEAFTTSSEFVDRHGDPTDEALVTILYQSVLGREPGPGGVEPFVQMLRSGELTRGSLVVAFTESPEFVAMTGTVTPDKPDLPYPAVGSGRRVIYANREARVWFVEATGELAKTHQVSGRRGVPAPDPIRIPLDPDPRRQVAIPNEGAARDAPIRRMRSSGLRRCRVDLRMGRRWHESDHDSVGRLRRRIEY